MRQNENIVHAKLVEYVNKYQKITGVELQPYTVKFRNGQPNSIGYVKTIASSTNIRFEFVFYNGYINQGVDNYCDYIVSHEVAHMITRLRFGKVKPHGKEFKNTCRLLGLTNDFSSRVCPLKFELPKNPNKFDYVCPVCGHEFQLSKSQHKKMVNYSGSYSHGKCGVRLKLK